MYTYLMCWRNSPITCHYSQCQCMGCPAYDTQCTAVIVFTDIATACCYMLTVTDQQKGGLAISATPILASRSVDAIETRTNPAVFRCIYNSTQPSHRKNVQKAPGTCPFTAA